MVIYKDTDLLMQVGDYILLNYFSINAFDHYVLFPVVQYKPAAHEVIS